jgi:hypothetical protein
VRSREPFRKQFCVYKRSCFRFRLFACILAQISDASSKWKIPTKTGELAYFRLAYSRVGTRTSWILTLIYILGYTSIYRGGRETGPVLHTGPPACVVSPFGGITVGHCVADPEKQVAQNAPRSTREAPQYAPIDSSRKRTQHPRDPNLPNGA